MRRPEKRCVAHNPTTTGATAMMQPKPTREFVELMEDYFRECKHLTRAAKAVGMSDLPSKQMLVTLWGLIEVLDKTATDAELEMTREDERLMTEQKPFLVRSRA
jgi:hypothetical protein